MPTTNPRLNVTLQPGTAALIKKLARREKKSVASFTKDLVLEALELREDVALARIAELREKEDAGKKLYSREEAWS